MKNILIETYRGFDIEFNTNNEKFQCIVSDDNAKESILFAAVKKFVDDYKKNNQEFKPFWVEPNPKSYRFGSGNLLVVGMRKDGRFVVETEEGIKKQLTDYDVNKYMLMKAENVFALKTIKALDVEFETIKANHEKKKNELIDSIVIVDLEEYKNNL